MITIYNKTNLKSTEEGEVSTFELRGLSTDTKPTEIGDEKVDNGSVFIEINTGKIFMYDFENQEWGEI